MLSSDPPCPAAAPLAGTSQVTQGLVCRAMQQDIERDDGTALGMSAGKYGYLQHEAFAGVHLNLKSDPTTVIKLCHGHGLPVLTDDDHQARDHYTYCPVWQAEKERLWAGRDQLAPEEQPEPVEMGLVDAMSSLDAPDPWAQGLKDLQRFGDPNVVQR